MRSLELINMPDPPRAEDITTVACGLAALMFQRDGEVLQHAYFVAGEEGRIVIASPSTDEPLDTAATHLRFSQWIENKYRELAKKLRARVIVQVAETWSTSNLEFGLSRGRMPEHDPNRREGILVLTESALAQPPISSHFAEIKRNGCEVRLEPFEKHPGTTNGRYAYLLPPESYGSGFRDPTNEDWSDKKVE